MTITAFASRIRFFACVFALATSQSLHALGLGDAQVLSFLGQPLDARVQLITQYQGELDSVTAKLAKADDYAIMGLDRTTLSVPLSFDIVGEHPGAYVRVTSSVAVNEPVLQLVLEVSFTNGRMFREYTLFLDPPTFSAPVPPPRITPRRAPPDPEPRPQSGTEPGPGPEPEPVLIPGPETGPMGVPLSGSGTGERPGEAPQAELAAEPGPAPVQSPPDGLAAGAAEQAAPSEQSDPQTSEPILQESAAEASVDSPVVEPERETGFDDIPRIPDTNPAPEDDTSGETIMAEPPSTQTLGVESQKPVVEADSQPTEAGSLEQETAESLQREEEAAEPDSVEPPAVEPETFEPEPVEFEPVEPESVEPGSAEPETVELESVESEAAETEITEPVITEPEAIEPEPAEPEYFESAAAETEGTEPDTAEPEPVEPETIEPETIEPEALEPESIEPETIGSETAESGTVETGPADPGTVTAPGQEADTTTAESTEIDSPVEAETPLVVYQPAGDSGESYGPVRAGETMWGIASEFVEGSEYSINQAMLAIQRRNPEAFIGNNINSLKRGAILRLPTFEQVTAMTRREAMLEAIRQEEEYRARREGRPFDRPAPMVVDVPAESTVAAGGTVETATAEPESPGTSIDARLELVPPAGVDLAETGTGGTGTGAGGNDAEAARSEEDLSNLQQEKAYLDEQIRELEARVEANRTGEPGEDGIADTGLAELESALREDRLAGEPDDPVVVVPPGEDDAWYSGKGWWLLLVFAAVLALVTWILFRVRGGGENGEADSGQLTEVAEDDSADIKSPQDEETGDSVTEPGFRVTAGPKVDEEAVELDADDPETKLDLARAYLSMGDLEQARTILEEVLAEGSTDQVAEARSMLAEI